MPRAQYVGYTATPFANVFIDLNDQQSLFPKDFVVGLKRPWGYMGASDFSDVAIDFGDDEASKNDPRRSNRAAFVRDLRADPTDPEARRVELQQALDTFVLVGAIKMYRFSKDPELTFRHHTMMVHESVRNAQQLSVADEVKAIWRESGYSTAAGFNRLRKIFNEDIRSVSEARIEAGVPNVTNFDDLKDHIGNCVQRIEEHEGNPVLVVNGDRDIQQQRLDFDAGSVWRVLVGGTKLSRGFTVEGLTVTYYRRTTTMHDTLTQAGRWFGFRHGYSDLVRLFIGREENFGKKKLDLLKAFDAIVEDEEEFRGQLRKYSVLVDGRPQMRPIDIPPIVSQHLFWLKPTAPNKMFNAVLTEQRDPEFGLDGHPKGKGALQDNLKLWEPLLKDLGESVHLLQTNSTSTTFAARCAIVKYEQVLSLLEQHAWLSSEYKESVVDPRLAFLRTLVGSVDDFAIISPQVTSGAVEDFPGIGLMPVVQRQRRFERGDVMGEPTDPKHRGPAQTIAAGLSGKDPVLDFLIAPRRGALLVYVMQDTSSPTVATRIVGFRIFLPLTTLAPGGRVVRFRARRPKSKKAVVDKVD